MDNEHYLLRTQYDYIKQSRSVLFNYCHSISNDKFLLENSSFGRGSIANLLAHMGNTYLFWIGQICLHRNLTYLEYGDIKNMDDILAHFATVDETVYSLLSADDINLFEERTYEINKVEGKASIFKIVTHVFTHEYHHKGQVLSLSRHLGYIPVDTDIMR
ncbi:DinB family protein [Subsaxibacter sp. CAU 1640]|uniref:DinB family protein n=1 Tax=Subsaxibacter sp. CAU 1640 TaxID=2933271 RepID=UPI002003CC78|nr:DinB family protein [Subsaxibacter sp. CAU 1640]MCK7590515.1 DinB family protein [Subsaxibacter sp. CAU 1640]